MTTTNIHHASSQERAWLNRYPASLQHAAAAAFGFSLSPVRANPIERKPG